MKSSRAKITRVTQKNLGNVVAALLATNCTIVEAKTVTKKRLRRGVPKFTVFAVIKYRLPLPSTKMQRRQARKLPVNMRTR
jgi:hypothetical protein